MVVVLIRWVRGLHSEAHWALLLQVDYCSWCQKSVPRCSWIMVSFWWSQLDGYVVVQLAGQLNNYITFHGPQVVHLEGQLFIWPLANWATRRPTEQLTIQLTSQKWYHFSWARFWEWVVPNNVCGNATPDASKIRCFPKQDACVAHLATAKRAFWIGVWEKLFDWKVKSCIGTASVGLFCSHTTSPIILQLVVDANIVPPLPRIDKIQDPVVFPLFLLRRVSKAASQLTNNDQSLRPCCERITPRVIEIPSQTISLYICIYIYSQWSEVNALIRHNACKQEKSGEQDTPTNRNNNTKAQTVATSEAVFKNKSERNRVSSVHMKRTWKERTMSCAHVYFSPPARVRYTNAYTKVRKQRTSNKPFPRVLHITLDMWSTHAPARPNAWETKQQSGVSVVGQKQQQKQRESISVYFCRKFLKTIALFKGETFRRDFRTKVISVFQGFKSRDA